MSEFFVVTYTEQDNFHISNNVNFGSSFLVGIFQFNGDQILVSRYPLTQSGLIFSNLSEKYYYHCEF